MIAANTLSTRSGGGRPAGPAQAGALPDLAQLDLPALLNGWTAAKNDLAEQSNFFEDFLRFYLFFSPAGHRESVQRKSLLRRLCKPLCQGPRRPCRR